MREKKKKIQAKKKSRLMIKRRKVVHHSNVSRGQLKKDICNHLSVARLRTLCKCSRSTFPSRFILRGDCILWKEGTALVAITKKELLPRIQAQIFPISQPLNWKKNFLAALETIKFADIKFLFSKYNTLGCDYLEKKQPKLKNEYKRWLYNAIFDKVPTQIKRGYERENLQRIGNDLDNMFFRFVTPNGKEHVLPCDVVNIIVSYLPKTRELLDSVGTLTTNWYLMCLKNWDTVSSMVLNVPLLVLRECKTLYAKLIATNCENHGNYIMDTMKKVQFLNLFSSNTCTTKMLKNLIQSKNWKSLKSIRISPVKRSVFTAAHKQFMIDEPLMKVIARECPKLEEIFAVFDCDLLVAVFSLPFVKSLGVIFFLSTKKWADLRGACFNKSQFKTLKRVAFFHFETSPSLEQCNWLTALYRFGVTLDVWEIESSMFFCLDAFSRMENFKMCKKIILHLNLKDSFCIDKWEFILRKPRMYYSLELICHFEPDFKKHLRLWWETFCKCYKFFPNLLFHVHPDVSTFSNLGDFETVLHQLKNNIRVKGLPIACKLPKDVKARIAYERFDDLFMYKNIKTI